MSDAPTAATRTSPLRRLWNGWRKVAHAIGHVQSLLILTVVYFVVVGPFALAVRLFSDPLALRTAVPDAWLTPDAAAVPDLASVRQQF